MSTGTSGHVTFDGIPAAIYVFRVVAVNHAGDRAVVRRRVQVIGMHAALSLLLWNGKGMCLKFTFANHIQKVIC